MTVNTKQLALDTVHFKETKGIPTGWCNIMEHSIIERIAGAAPGDYKKEPEKTYLACQQGLGSCLIDQWIPLNPLTMEEKGYQDAEKGTTTGAEQIICDGIDINSPEAVVEHMERHVFPELEKEAKAFDEEKRVREIIDKEAATQKELGPDILKTGYTFIGFPCLRYTQYGYVNYLMAYALYPDVMEKDFSLQADVAVLNNRAAARAYQEGNLPPLYRLDHDMADSRSTLVDIDSLDTIWFPHFARALEPMVKTDVKMIWHCDGNLMEMVPRLIQAGVRGFQGFQYEDGMDYEKICQMKDSGGNDLFIMGGVSVTTTLPKGKPDDVKKEIDWLVEKGPKKGLVLQASSSVAPGVPWENIETMIEGFRYYREKGRE